MHSTILQKMHARRANTGRQGHSRAGGAAAILLQQPPGLRQPSLSTAAALYCCLHSCGCSLASCAAAGMRLGLDSASPSSSLSSSSSSSSSCAAGEGFWSAGRRLGEQAAYDADGSAGSLACTQGAGQAQTADMCLPLTGLLQLRRTGTTAPTMHVRTPAGMQCVRRHGV